eukprot:GEZU01029458.1.p1 GENE.GEZU01029458.1~~GEZU01029458.1.p1  ORF type:complete len:320 (+),score=107.26 GEZU01029458.1:34-993(+)
MPLYECVYWMGVKHGLTAVNNNIRRNAKHIVQNGGVIRRLENMGVTQLAYPMKRRRETHVWGRLVLMLFDGSPKTQTELNAMLSSDEMVFRWVFYKVKDPFRALFDDRKFRPLPVDDIKGDGTPLLFGQGLAPYFQTKTKIGDEINRMQQGELTEEEFNTDDFEEAEFMSTFGAPDEAERDTLGAENFEFLRQQSLDSQKKYERMLKKYEELEKQREAEAAADAEQERLGAIEDRISQRSGIFGRERDAKKTDFSADLLDALSSATAKPKSKSKEELMFAKLLGELEEESKAAKPSDTDSGSHLFDFLQQPSDKNNNKK